MIFCYFSKIIFDIVSFDVLTIPMKMEEDDLWMKMVLIETRRSKWAKPSFPPFSRKSIKSFSFWIFLEKENSSLLTFSFEDFLIFSEKMSRKSSIATKVTVCQLRVAIGPVVKVEQLWVQLHTLRLRRPFFMHHSLG